MQILFRGVLIFLGCWLSFSTYAQNCEANLRQLEKDFRSGFEIREADILNCIGSFNKDDKIRAYKYLILGNLLRDNLSKSRKYMPNFIKLVLRDNPDYSPLYASPEQESKEFIQLYNEFRHWPYFYYAFHGGLNWTYVVPTQSFRVGQTAASSDSTWDYQSQLGYQFGLGIEVPLRRKNARLGIHWFLAPEINWLRHSYKYQENLLGFARIEFVENQDWIQLPVLLKYYFRREEAISKNEKPILNKFQPFLTGGASIAYLISSRADISRTDELGGGRGNREPITPIPTGRDIELNDQRKSFNYALILGGGFRLKNILSSGWDLSLESRFQFGLNSLVKADSRDLNQELLYDYGYIDDDFRINNFTISLKLLIPKYNPKQTKFSGKPYSTSFGINPTEKNKKKK